MNLVHLPNKIADKFFPLSVRGLLLLALSFYFMFGPAKRSSDIIAASFAFCALTALVLFLCLALLSRRRLKKSLVVTLSSQSDSESSYSQDTGSKSDNSEAGQPIALIAKLSGISIPPFFELRLRYVFEQEGIKSQTHSLSTSCPSEKFILEMINFPHRGKWLLKGISFTLVDHLGLTNTSLPFWQLNNEIEIAPKPFNCPRWPIIASTIRTDDQIHHPVERRGDMYDLKQYHPTDGSRKIVWKLFAKSGQLFSRYPEPAYSPEGKVALLCLAKKFDDKLVSETATYLEELTDLDIDILVATLSQTPRIAYNIVQAKNNMIEDAWDSENAEAEDVTKAIHQLILAAQGQNNERSLQTVVLAVSEESLNDSNYREIVMAAQLTLLQSGIRPSIFISSDLSTKHFENRKSTKSPILSIVRNLLLENEKTRVPNNGPKEAQSFIASLSSATSDLAWS